MPPPNDHDDHDDDHDHDGNPTCDLCDRPAVVHTTEISDGVTTHRHLCAGHAAEAPELHPLEPLTGVASAASSLFAESQALAGLAANLRGTANYIRRHGRMPATVAELEEGMSLRPPFPTTETTDPHLRTYLQESDALLEFVDTLGRLPPPPDDPPVP